MTDDEVAVARGVDHRLMRCGQPGNTSSFMALRTSVKPPARDQSTLGARSVSGEISKHCMAAGT